MPRAVIVLCANTDLLHSVQEAVRRDQRFIRTEDGLHCDGSKAPLTNIYPVDLSPLEWEGWESPGGGMPDPRSMSALVLETRSPAWVVEIGALISAGIDAPVWIVDAADQAWPAGRVDVERVALA